MTNLTEHFTLEELTASPTATARKISNKPMIAHQANLKAVCEKILEPVRKHYGRPVTINSGYRSPALNKAVGGSTTSQHSNGEAVDFEVPGVANMDVADWVAENCPFDQIILEFYNPAEGAASGWVHVSYKSDGSKNRGQKLIALKSGGKTVYKTIQDYNPAT